MPQLSPSTNHEAAIDCNCSNLLHYYHSASGIRQIDDKSGEKEDADVEPFRVVEDAGWLSAYN